MDVETQTPPFNPQMVASYSEGDDFLHVQIIDDNGVVIGTEDLPEVPTVQTGAGYGFDLINDPNAGSPGGKKRKRK